MTIFINESRALKIKLSDIRLHSTNGPREGALVPVEFVGPDFELGDANYPGIYLRYGLISRAKDREMRGQIALPYAPEGFSGDVQVPVDMHDKNNPATQAWLVNKSSEGNPHASPYYVEDCPIPYNVDFDVAVLTRNYQQAMEIAGKMTSRKYLPERFGFLEVPEDGTVRTLELLGGPEFTLQKDADDKRIIQTLYSVRVASEVNEYEIQTVKRTRTVIITDGPPLEEVLINLYDL